MFVCVSVCGVCLVLTSVSVCSLCCRLFPITLMLPSFQSVALSAWPGTVVAVPCWDNSLTLCKAGEGLNRKNYDAHAAVRKLYPRHLSEFSSTSSCIVFIPFPGQTLANPFKAAGSCRRIPLQCICSSSFTIRKYAYIR